MSTMNELWVIAIGDAFRGIRLVGPFESCDAAQNHAAMEIYDVDWHIVKVDSQ